MGGFGIKFLNSWAAMARCGSAGWRSFQSQLPYEQTASDLTDAGSDLEISSQLGHSFPFTLSVGAHFSVDANRQREGEKKIPCSRLVAWHYALSCASQLGGFPIDRARQEQEHAEVLLQRWISSSRTSKMSGGRTWKHGAYAGTVPTLDAHSVCSRQHVLFPKYVLHSETCR